MNFLKRNLAIVAALLLSTVLGSVHAFSVFVPEWEQFEGANRAQVSLVYSVALVSLTLMVLVGYRIYAWVSASNLFLCVGLIAGLGLLISANASSLTVLVICYGILFGGANGVGYGYALQLAAQAAPQSRGMAMGFVTAFYAVGATITPLAFVYLIEKGGNALALNSMSIVVFCVAGLAAGMLKHSNFVFTSEPLSEKFVLSPESRRTRLMFWVAYGSAVCAGLMVIGHAFGIALWSQLSSSSAAVATTSVALGNMLGGFSIGFYADKLASRALLGYLPAISVFGLMLLAFGLNEKVLIVFFSLGLVGYSYGAIIAVYPVAVVDAFGTSASPRIYGQIFTAWGLAGLVGPWASGWLFDASGSYSVALIIAMLLSCISLFVIRRG